MSKIKSMLPLGRTSRWSLLFAFPLAALLFYLSFRGASWSEMVGTIRKAHSLYLILTSLIVTLSLFLRGFRWNVLLGPEKSIPPVTVFWGIVVGNLGNNFLPARAGDFIRSAMIGRYADISKTYTFATIITERIIDVLALVLIGLVVLHGLEGMPAWLLSTIPVVLVFGLASLGALFVLPCLEDWFKNRLAGIRMSDPWRSRINHLLEKFLLGMRVFHHWGRALHYIGLTGLVWAIDALTVIALGWALNLTLPWKGAFLLLTALGLGSALPSTPGYVGIYQFVAVAVLTPFHFSRSEALAYIITFQIVNYVVLIVWGSIGFWRLSTKGQAGDP